MKYLFLILIFVYGVAFSEIITTGLLTGYNSNIYKNNDNYQSAYPTIFKAALTYDKNLKKHMLGLAGTFESAYYVVGANQNYTIYSVTPKYKYSLKDKFTVGGNYNYTLDREAAITTAGDVRYNIKNVVDIFADAKSNDNTFLMLVNLANRTYKEKEKLLDYRNNTDRELNIELNYFLYPETAFVVGGFYENVKFHAGNVDLGVFEVGYNLIKATVGFDSTISKNVFLKLHFIGKYFNYEDDSIVYGLDLDALVISKISENIELNTKYKRELAPHRIADSRNKNINELSFSGKILLDPTLMSDASVIYRLISYQKPNPRNELNLILHFGLKKQFYKNLSLAPLYDFEFVRSDGVSADVYNNSEMVSYNNHKIMLGLNWTY